MSNKNICKQWKSIVVHYESKKQTIIFDLDEKQRLKTKMKRMKKRSLMLECASSSNNKLQNLCLQKVYEKLQSLKALKRSTTSYPNENNQNDSSISEITDDINNLSCENVDLNNNMQFDIFKNDISFENENLEGFDMFNF